VNVNVSYCSTDVQNFTLSNVILCSSFRILTAENLEHNTHKFEYNFSLVPHTVGKVKYLQQIKGWLVGV